MKRADANHITTKSSVQFHSERGRCLSSHGFAQNAPSRRRTLRVRCWAAPLVSAAAGSSRLPPTDCCKLQRVTDIEFFAEDVHLLASVSSDGRLFVWRIVENVEFQLHAHVILAIQFEGPWNNMQPCVSWHPGSQECLLMCLCDLVLRIDIGEAWKKASNFKFSAESFLSCPIANLVDGVSCIGQHDADVTDLSVFLQDRLYVASASKDGTVRIWGSGQTSPLAILIPHEGQPVGCVFFITSLTQPDEAVLLTSDSTSKNLKLWVSATSRTCCVWYSVQTLEFRNCNGKLTEQVVPNHCCTVPQAGLVLFGRLENSAIYSVHLKFGNASSAVRMHYLAEFFVSMPILSITALTETGSSCKHIAHVFCVQTEAIQEYFLNIVYRLSSQCNEPGLLSSSAALLEKSFVKMSVHDAIEAKEHSKSQDLESQEVAEIAAGNRGSTCELNLVGNPGSGFGSWVEVPSWIAAHVKTTSMGVSMEAKATDFKEKNLAYCASPLATGTSVGSIQSYEEEPSFASRTTGDISTKSSFVPKPSILSTDSSSLKMAEDGILPVVHLTRGLCHIYTSGEQVSTLNVLSDSVNEQLCGISSMLNSSQEETVRQVEVNARLEGASAVSGRVVMANLGGIKLVVDDYRVDTFDVTAVGIDELEVPTEIGLTHFEPRMDSTLCAEEQKQDALVAKESFQISGECQEHEKGGGVPISTVQGLSNVSKKKRNRRKIKGSNRANKSTTVMPAVNLDDEKLSLLCRTFEYGMPCLSKVGMEDKVDRSFAPSYNRLEDLSVQISAMQASLDQLCVSQTQIQENVSSLFEVPLFSEFDSPSALLQDCINFDIGTSLDPFWRQSGDNFGDKNALQQEWTHRLLKASNELLTKVKTTAAPMLMAEVLHYIGSNIGPVISSSVDNFITTSLLQNVEDCNKNFLKVGESSVEVVLNSTVKEQLESIWLFFWKHLMQVERN